MPIPPKIANAPELTLGLELYLEGFLDLSSCRSVGMSLGPIPWTAMDRYCEVEGIADETRDDFIYLVKGLDVYYLELMEAKSKRESR